MKLDGGRIFNVLVVDLNKWCPFIRRHVSFDMCIHRHLFVYHKYRSHRTAPSHRGSRPEHTPGSQGRIFCPEKQTRLFVGLSPLRRADMVRCWAHRSRRHGEIPSGTFIHLYLIPWTASLRVRMQSVPQTRTTGHQRSCPLGRQVST